jgi:hypothetical protein
LYNDGFRNMYSLPNIFTMIKSTDDEMVRACSTYGVEEEWKARRTQTTRKI